MGVTEQLGWIVVVNVVVTGVGVIVLMRVVVDGAGWMVLHSDNSFLTAPHKFA